MCTWNRLHNFKRTIDVLNSQKKCKFELYVWNNNIEYGKQLETLSKHANFKITFHHSVNNIGGFGRFYFAKAIAEKYPNTEYCIFIDDDQTFDKSTIRKLYDERAKNTIVSQYGWVFNSDYYYDRYKPKHGEIIDYAGTGGMIADIEIFKKEMLYHCPSQYWAVEDLWLSFCAKNYFDCELKQSAAKMQQLDDVESLCNITGDTKIEMLRVLIHNMGFKIKNNNIK